MARFDDLFKNVSSRRTKEAQERALEIISKKSKKKITGSIVVPKTMRDKVDLAKDMSMQVFSDRLDKMELVTSIDRIEEYAKKVIENGILAVDTETNGLDRIDGDIAGICLYTPGEKGIYIPVGHKSFMTNVPLEMNIPAEYMRELFERFNSSNIKYILHNAKFDMHILYWMIGVKIVPYWDTLIGGYLLNENEPHGLKALWKKYCTTGDESQETASFNSLFNGIEFNKIPPDVGYMYAAFDPIMTYELYKFQFDYLDKEGEYCYQKGLERVAEVFRQIEMPLIEVVFEMEATGIKIDTDLAKELTEKYTVYMDRAKEMFDKEVAKLDKEFDKLIVKSPDKYSKLFKDGKREISISSPTQLAILFYDILKFESPDQRKPRGTGEDIIKTFKHPVVTSILEYRSMAKLLSTYVEAIPTHISKKDNKLHAQFNQYGAKTGRFSSSDPNLQNLPSGKTKLHDGTIIEAGKDIRQMLLADEGHVMIGADFSQQEPRILAHMSNDVHMIQAYKENKDLYAIIASKLYNKPYDECKEFRPDGTLNPEGKTRRNSVKSILLGIMYGRGTSSIAEQMGITFEQAQDIVKDFFNEFPKVKEFVDFAQSFASQYGFVETAWGRKRRLTDMLLPPIEITCNPTSKSINFNPLFDDDEEEEEEGYVSDEVYYKYLNLMKRAFGKKAKDEIKEMAKKEGYDIKDNGGYIADAQRQCVNSIIQGSAADATKIAMIDLFRNKELRELGYKLIITVHDEVIGICPQDNAKRVMEIVEYVMINSVSTKLKVPMKTDLECTYRWYGEGVEL